MGAIRTPQFSDIFDVDNNDVNMVKWCKLLRLISQERPWKIRTKTHINKQDADGRHMLCKAPKGHITSKLDRIPDGNSSQLQLVNTTPTAWPPRFTDRALSPSAKLTAAVADHGRLSRRCRRQRWSSVRREDHCVRGAVLRHRAMGGAMFGYDLGTSGTNTTSEFQTHIPTDYRMFCTAQVACHPWGRSSRSSSRTCTGG